MEKLEQNNFTVIADNAWKIAECFGTCAFVIAESGNAYVMSEGAAARALEVGGLKQFLVVSSQELAKCDKPGNLIYQAAKKISF